jgi:DNA-binding IclR family transcriptional regulator
MGLQLLDRAVSLLRALGGGGEDGLRLVDLQRATGLSKPTAHRLLAGLIENGLVAHDATTRRYRLGHELVVLGWSVAQRSRDLQAIAAHSAARLAEECGDTVFVVARSGLDTVCIERRSGTYPIKALTVDVGTRRPLGVGAGGLAILASMPEDEAEAALAAVAPRLAAFTSTPLAQLQAAVREARRHGYAVSNGFVTEGVRAISTVVRDFRGESIAAIGVAAILPRIPRARIAELAEALDRERRRIESRLLSGLGSGEAEPDNAAPRPRAARAAA